MLVHTLFLKFYIYTLDQNFDQWFKRNSSRKIILEFSALSIPLSVYKIFSLWSNTSFMGYKEIMFPCYLILWDNIVHYKKDLRSCLFVIVPLFRIKWWTYVIIYVLRNALDKFLWDLWFFTKTLNWLRCFERFLSNIIFDFYFCDCVHLRATL